MKKLLLLLPFLFGIGKIYASDFYLPGITYVTVAPSGPCIYPPTLYVVKSTGAAWGCIGGTYTLMFSGGGGSGTVSSVSVVTVNGVSGSVANPTTTPAISLTLGAITPSSVTIPNDGVHPNQISLPWNSIANPAPSNATGWEGSVSASGTPGWFDLPSALPSVPSVWVFGAGSSDHSVPVQTPPTITINSQAMSLGGSYTITLPTTGIVAASTPVFSPVSGAYGSTQSVTASCTYGTIECNASGSAPLLGSCSSISVSVSQTITAGCFGLGYIPVVTSAAYIIGSGSIKTYAACDNFNGTATCAMNPTSGNFLVAYTTPSSAGAASPLTPSGCVTWTQIGSATSQGDSLWKGTVASSGACNITASNTSTVGILVAEVQNAISTVDGTPGYLNSTLSGGSAAGPSTTTTQNGDVILSFLYDGAATYLLNSPWTSTFSGNTATETKGVSIGYFVQVSAGAVNPTFTVSTGSGQHSATVALEL